SGRHRTAPPYDRRRLLDPDRSSLSNSESDASGLPRAARPEPPQEQADAPVLTMLLSRVLSTILGWSLRPRHTLSVPGRTATERCRPCVKVAHSQVLSESSPRRRSELRPEIAPGVGRVQGDRKSTRLNSSH